MDIITQGLLGAAASQAVASDDERRTALWVGFLAGLLADIDALFPFILGNTDPLLQLEFHRHFTHALIFIPIGGLLAALLLYSIIPPLRKTLSFKRLLLLTTASYATSGLLDACTSYGTNLLWPFSDTRIAWNIIAIVDPIFSFTLIIGLWLTYKPKSTPRPTQEKSSRHRPIHIALVITGLYLLLGFAQHQRVESIMQATVNQRGHHIERIEIKPTLGNLLLWRSVYEYDGVFYADGIHAGINNQVYAGEHQQRFVRSDLSNVPTNSRQGLAINRFAYFSNNYLALQKSKLENHIYLGDIRYAMLPTSMNAIWGLELNNYNFKLYPAFVQYHKMSTTERQQWLDMLLGRTLSTVQ
ncbi:MAG: metal-dependent hydrolase [Mariprofundales bacterium]